MAKETGLGQAPGSPVWSIVTDDAGPGLRVRHDGSSGNAIEVVGPNGRVLWQVDRAGSAGGSFYAPLPSGDATGVTDSANLQAAINSTPVGGTLWLAGNYTVKTGLSVTQGISIRGIYGQWASATSQAGTNLTAVAASTGPILSIAPGALVHSIHVENIGIDLTAAPTLTGFYFTNMDNTVCKGLFVRDGACAYQLDGVQLFTMRDCFAFNQRTRGWYSSGVSNVDIRFDNCVYEQTIGATWACTAAWDIAAGASFMFYGCEALRAPTGTGNWLSYGIHVTSAAATTWLFMVNCWLDAISDGTGANSANSTPLNLTSTTINVRASNCFFSASSSAGQKQRAVRVNGGSDHQFVNCTFGGAGVEFATGNCARMGITNCNFVQQFGDAAVTFTGGAAPTDGTFANNTLQAAATAGVVASAADAISFQNWTKGALTDA